jgi:molecular chaperone HtpG
MQKSKELLNKYNKFMPIQFGTKTQTLLNEDAPEDAVAETITVNNIINNPNPAWKQPTELAAEDYKTFYRLYPMQFDEPLFHIHLNVDYPFNLTGISQN